MLHGEEVAQIVGEHLGRLHPGFTAQLFHDVVDVGTVEGLARPGDKHAALFDAALPGVNPQLFAQLQRQDDPAGLALVAHHRLTETTNNTMDLSTICGSRSGNTESSLHQ